MKFLVIALSLASWSAQAAYDNSWYEADFWSGEYPNGFSVVKKDVTVPARKNPDQEEAATISCGLPFKAVIHPWNASRPADFLTFSKIIPLTVKEDFTFQDEEDAIPLKKGEVIEYLIYGAEGWFSVRIKGEIYEADQDLFEKMEPVDESLFRQDEWVGLNCTSGEKAWIFLPDLTKEDSNGNETFLPGLDSWSLGMVEYGSVRDLTDKDLNKSK